MPDGVAGFLILNMRYISILFLSLILICCKSSYISLTEEKSAFIILGAKEKFKNLPELQFFPSTEIEFSKYITAKKADLTMLDSLPIFEIPTVKKHFTYRPYKDYGGEDGWKGIEVNNYYPEIKMYAVTNNWTSDDFGFSELILIDSITSKIYKVASFGDGAVSPPIISPDSKFMAYYDNTMFEQKGCTIGILKINSKKSPAKYLEEYRFYETEEFAIEEIRWINDTSFIVKGYEEVYENETWVKKNSYYKTSL
ncbi:MAG: hypothetical protein ACO1N9_07640 [Flavobacterium sp.]